MAHSTNTFNNPLENQKKEIFSKIDWILENLKSQDLHKIEKEIQELTDGKEHISIQNAISNVLEKDPILNEFNKLDQKLENYLKNFSESNLIDSEILKLKEDKKSNDNLNDNESQNELEKLENMQVKIGQITEDLTSTCKNKNKNKSLNKNFSKIKKQKGQLNNLSNSHIPTENLNKQKNYEDDSNADITQETKDETNNLFNSDLPLEDLNKEEKKKSTINEKDLDSKEDLDKNCDVEVIKKLSIRKGKNNAKKEKILKLEETIESQQGYELTKNAGNESETIKNDEIIPQESKNLIEILKSDFKELNDIETDINKTSIKLTEKMKKIVTSKKMDKNQKFQKFMGYVSAIKSLINQENKIVIMKKNLLEKIYSLNIKNAKNIEIIRNQLAEEVNRVQKQTPRFDVNGIIDLLKFLKSQINEEPIKIHNENEAKIDNEKAALVNNYIVIQKDDNAEVYSDEEEIETEKNITKENKKHSGKVTKSIVKKTLKIDQEVEKNKTEKKKRNGKIIIKNKSENETSKKSKKSKKIKEVHTKQDKKESSKKSDDSDEKPKSNLGQENSQTNNENHHESNNDKKENEKESKEIEEGKIEADEKISIEDSNLKILTMNDNIYITDSNSTISNPAFLESKIRKMKARKLKTKKPVVDLSIKLSDLSNKSEEENDSKDIFNNKGKSPLISFDDFEKIIEKDTTSLSPNSSEEKISKVFAHAKELIFNSKIFTDEDSDIFIKTLKKNEIEISDVQMIKNINFKLNTLIEIISNFYKHLEQKVSVVNDDIIKLKFINRIKKNKEIFYQLKSLSEMFMQSLHILDKNVIQKKENNLYLEKLAHKLMDLKGKLQEYMLKSNNKSKESSVENDIMDIREMKIKMNDYLELYKGLKIRNKNILLSDSILRKIIENNLNILKKDTLIKIFEK